MPALAWIAGALGVGAVGGYVLGVKTSDAIMAAAVLGGAYYLLRGR